MPLSGEAAIAAGVGVGTVFVGYLIRFRGWTFLVAGYDRTVGVDDELVADVVGSMVLRVGLATLAVAALAAFGSLTDLVELVFVAAVLLEVGRTVYRLNAATRA